MRVEDSGDRKWYDAVVLATSDGKACIQYKGWDSRYNEWLDMKSPRLGGAGDKAPPQRAAASASEERSDGVGSSRTNSDAWSCASCTFLNPASARECKMCQGTPPKPATRPRNTQKRCLAWRDTIRLVRNHAKKARSALAAKQHASLAKCKREIQSVLLKLRKANTRGEPVGQNLFGPAVITYESIVCCVCRDTSGDDSTGNEVVLCDGPCGRAYHLRCLSPPIRLEHVPQGDAKWFCHMCACESVCIGIANRELGADFKSPSDLSPNAAESANFSATPAQVSNGDETEDDDQTDSQEDIGGTSSASRKRKRVGRKGGVTTPGAKEPKYLDWWRRSIGEKGIATKVRQGNKSGARRKQPPKRRRKTAPRKGASLASERKGKAKRGSGGSRSSASKKKSAVSDSDRSALWKRALESKAVWERLRQEKQAGNEKNSASRADSAAAAAAAPARTRAKKPGPNKWKVVWSGQVRVRVEPSMVAPSVGILESGDVLDVLEHRGNWVRHKLGWSLSADSDDELIRPCARTTQPPPLTCQRVRVKFDDGVWYMGTIVKVSPARGKSAKGKWTIVIKYDDKAMEKSLYPDPDIQIVRSSLL